MSIELSANSSITDELADYAYTPDLARDQRVVVLVKWLNQRYHDDNLRTMHTDLWDPIRGISRTNSTRHRNQYYDGLIVSTDLSDDIITSARADYIEHAVQPTAIDFRNDQLAIAVGNRLLVRSELTDTSSQTEIRNPWFARLHSVEITDDETLLTASSAFDLIFEVDQDGSIIWSADLWELGYDENQLGDSFTRSIPENGAYVLNPSELTLRNGEDDLHKQKMVVEDPRHYNGLGLPTNITPAFVNGISQSEDTLLATSFSHGEAWVIDKNTLQISTVLNGLEHPHGFRETSEGLVIANTGGDQVLFLNSDYSVRKVLDLNSLGGKKQGLEAVSWLQDAVELAPGLFALISIPRQSIYICDVINKAYRRIHLDPDWGVQTIAAIPE